MKATATHLELTHRDVFRIVLALASVGFVLAFFGLRAAFAEVGYDSREGHIIMAAGLIMAALTVGALIVSRVLQRRILRRGL